jgi:hypothetical protein
MKTMHENLGSISISSVQTWILLANLCAASLDAGRELLYFGMNTYHTPTTRHLSRARNVTVVNC